MGNWDEHLAMQTFLNEAVAGFEIPNINEDLLAFLLGIAQHEIYDLLVNERPIQVQRIDFQKIDTLKSEMPSIYLNLLGIGVALWKTFKQYHAEQDRAQLRHRLLGLLGAITPDLLEGLRLVLLPDGKEAWMQGDADTFHFTLDDWHYPVDTFEDGEKDLQRRILIQDLTLSLELFRIEF